LQTTQISHINNNVNVNVVDGMLDALGITAGHAAGFLGHDTL
jgi:hypothetical protein